MAYEFVTLRDGSERHGLLLPPGDQATFCDDQEAPNHDVRGFFDGPSCSEEGPLRAPTDPRTGMPLAIAPRSDLASVPDELITVHHHCFPKLSRRLRTLGGRALRVSRLQKTTKGQHNYGPFAFHRFYGALGGPELPEEEPDQLGFVGLALANYLPEQVVDTSSGEPVIRTAHPWELRRLSEPGQFVEPLPRQVKTYRDKWHPHLRLVEAKRVLVEQRKQQAVLTYHMLQYGLDPMKDFVTHCVLQQDLGEVKRSLRTKFENTGDIESGLKILGIAAVMASQWAQVKGENLDVVYSRMRAEGRLHPLMPERAGTLLMHKLGNYAGRVALLPTLRSTLCEGNSEPLRDVA